MLSAREVADYILSLQEDLEEGDAITNLKLQKLMYYAQGFHLAVFDKPLFPEKIYKWTHGPVVEDLYHEIKQYGSGPIPISSDLDFSKFSEKVKELLAEIQNVFGQFSAWKLRNMTHQEPPFLQTRDQGEITLSVMKDYFITQIKTE